MSLVGSYTQPYVVQSSSETLYAPYYATTRGFEPQTQDSSYYNWPFGNGGGNPETPDSMSPLAADYSPPPPYGTPPSPVHCNNGGITLESGEVMQFMTIGPDGQRRGVKRRVTANKKERRRTQSINNAFADLRDCIPNVPADTKLSKIKTLRLATSYIAYLMDLLSQEDQCRATDGGFKAELSKKFENREEKRKKEIANLIGGFQQEKKPKGRTGWPQAVWALELQHD